MYKTSIYPTKITTKTKKERTVHWRIKEATYLCTWFKWISNEKEEDENDIENKRTEFNGVDINNRTRQRKMQ